MARIYAGILGALALSTSLVDGLVHGREPQEVLLVAWMSLLAFSVIGCGAGWIAGRIVRELVEAAVAAEVGGHASEDPRPVDAPSD